MGLLSDILHDAERECLEAAWGKTEAAEEFAPLPGGEYVARIISGEFETSKSNNTPGYKLEFKIVEGDYVGRKIWHDVWLTEAALPMAKRDLGKLGINSLEQLENPLPPGIRCKIKLALRHDDDGNEYNRVRKFEVIGIDEAEPDDLAPSENNGDGTEEDNYEY